jgi:hypothetical protein
MRRKEWRLRRLSVRPALQRWRRSGVSVWYNFRVNQNRIYTVYALISLPRKPYIHRIYIVLANLSIGVGQNRVCTPYVTIWPYIWQSPCQNNHIYTSYLQFSRQP